MERIVEGFSNPWEHVRLLSDRRRNQALLQMLEQLAPGRRVLEVGCGSGLLSCAAARLGATRVIAVEPGGMAAVARQLIAHNQLGDRVQLRAQRIEELEPEPVDLAFSELLNADPYVEGVVEAMQTASRWLAPGGQLSPRRLQVHAALVAAEGSAREVRDAQAEIERIAQRVGLEVEPLRAGLQTRQSYRYLAPSLRLLGPPVLAHDLVLGDGSQPPTRVELRMEAEEADAVAGVALWFRAELTDDLWLGNPPGQPGHWGHLVCAWPELVGVRAGGALRVPLQLDESDSLDAAPPL